MDAEGTAVVKTTVRALPPIAAITDPLLNVAPVHMFTVSSGVKLPV